MNQLTNNILQQAENFPRLYWISTAESPGVCKLKELFHFIYVVMSIQQHQFNLYMICYLHDLLLARNSHAASFNSLCVFFFNTYYYTLWSYRMKDSFFFFQPKQRMKPLLLANTVLALTQVKHERHVDSIFTDVDINRLLVCLSTFPCAYCVLRS